MQKNEMLENLLSQDKRETEIDCAVMLSGGKDSTYLLYLITQIYHKKAVAVMVDNGFESHSKHFAAEYAKKLNVELIIINYAKEFEWFFQTQILEYQKFHKDKFNHLCITCNNLLLACATNYASEHNIPYIITGLEKSQLNSGRKIDLDYSLKSNSIAKNTSKYILQQAKNKMKHTEIYQNNKNYRLFVNQMFKIPSDISVIYPFLYLEYNINLIKNILVEKLDWRPPVDKEINEYVSSGCLMTKVLPQLEKIGMIQIMEDAHLERLIYKDNALGTEYLKARDVGCPNVVELYDEIFDKLKIKEFLIKQCQLKDLKYAE